MPKFIDAYDTTTGKKHYIPEHWLGLKHPQFAKFSKTPRQRQADRDAAAAGAAQSYPEGAPAEEWSVKELRAWAADHEVPVGSSATKAEILDAALSTDAAAVEDNASA